MYMRNKFLNYRWIVFQMTDVFFYETIYVKVNLLHNFI